MISRLIEWLGLARSPHQVQEQPLLVLWARSGYNC